VKRNREKVVEGELRKWFSDAEIRNDRTAAAPGICIFANKVRARERREVPSAPLERGSGGLELGKRANRASTTGSQEQ
jgi:hypothetical protein